tara:strand:+ start:463 stop:630 length:168 start_codon:yes stop_codon:yes gene_type:complete
MMNEYDDFDISIKIIVHDLEPDYKGVTEYSHKILDDKTVHAIIEQVAKAREKNNE